MEVVAGALPSLLLKLGELIAGEYNLQKEVKGGIIYLQAELESMQAALEEMAKSPADQLRNHDKIWSRNMRELSYDIEDNIDTFMIHCKAKQHAAVSKTIIDRSLELLMQPKIRHTIAIDIEDLKRRVKEVAKRRNRFKVNNKILKPVVIDPRLLAQYEKATELVGIDEAKEEVIKILMEGNDMSKKQDKIVSIAGFGGLGKTTLASVVYEELRAQFDCSAFVSVSQTPNIEKLLMDVLSQFGKKKTGCINVINQLREFLKKKRYIIVIDDIWDISVWGNIKCALPCNNFGNKIITTTRNLNVAEQVGGAYKLQPLSPNYSRELLYRRLFDNEIEGNNEDTKYPDKELVEVSEGILKKCAGVPLAIITMGSLLACKPKSKMEWYKVYSYVGTGLEKSLALENMRKILSFSYFDLPYHLRTCLLYLSMFPEDYKINKNRLIRMWIAEGFIKTREQSKSLYEQGEGYFNELINRSMIQPIHNSYSGTIEHCRVHDMVLDLIRSLSSEENFITILSDIDVTFPSIMARRLSLQTSKEGHAMTEATTSLQQIRSVVVFPSGIDLMPGIGRFRVLRVLDLQYCTLSSQSHSLRYLGNLLHLRYLGLRSTGIAQLPEEIGKLQNLQTLNLMQNQISGRLPSTIVQLRNLMCLLTDNWTIMPKGIGNLACLEEVSKLSIDKSTMDTIEEIGQLKELRVLHIVLSKWNDKLVNCLHKLKMIKNLCIEVSGQRSKGGLDDWLAPQHIHALDTRRSCWFSRLPNWMNPARVMKLSILSIAITELHVKDLEVLARLPALRNLELEVDHENLKDHQNFVFGAGCFPCLVRGKFLGFAWPVVFRRGSMPKLQELIFSHSYASVVHSSRLSLGKLPSLKSIAIDFVSQCDRKEAVKQAKDALHVAVQKHPKHPTLRI